MEECDGFQSIKGSTRKLASQPLLLSIDDTMVERKGEKFELCLKLF